MNKQKQPTPHALKDHVPHGYGLKIAAKAGVTAKVVSEHLNGLTFSERVEVALIEILEEVQAQRKKLEKRKQQLLRKTA